MANYTNQKRLAEQMAVLNSEQFVNESASFHDSSHNMMNATCPAAFANTTWTRPQIKREIEKTSGTPEVNYRLKRLKREERGDFGDYVRNSRQRLCQGYLRGYCSYGSYCRFKHGSSENLKHKTPSPSNFHQSTSSSRCSSRNDDGRIRKVGEKQMIHKFSPPLRQFYSSRFRSRTVCRNYAADGRCSYGDRCHFTHVERRPVFVNPNATLATIPIPQFNPSVPPPFSRPVQVPVYENQQQFCMTRTSPTPVPVFQIPVNPNSHQADVNIINTTYPTYRAILPAHLPHHQQQQQFINLTPWPPMNYYPPGTTMH